MYSGSDWNVQNQLPRRNEGGPVHILLILLILLGPHRTKQMSKITPDNIHPENPDPNPITKPLTDWENSRKYPTVEIACTFV